MVVPELADRHLREGAMYQRRFAMREQEDFLYLLGRFLWRCAGEDSVFLS